MAELSDAVRKGGYDCKFLDPKDPPTCLLCLICLFVARSPQQMNCCGKLYCEECITRQYKASQKCSHCRAAGNSFKDKRAEQQILSLIAKCDHCEEGCKWTGELRSLEEHKRKECCYTLLPCPNKCEMYAYNMHRKDIDYHLKHQCPKRSYRCTECGEVGKFDDITTEHPKVCPNAMVECSNEGCTSTYRRSNLKLHKCLYERVNCIYSNIGCTKKPLRKDKQSHEKDERHLQIAAEVVAKLITEVTIFRQDMNYWVQYVQEKIEDTEQNKRNLQRATENLARLNTEVTAFKEEMKCTKQYMQQNKRNLEKVTEELRSKYEEVTDLKEEMKCTKQYMQQNKRNLEKVTEELRSKYEEVTDLKKDRKRTEQKIVALEQENAKFWVYLGIAFTILVIYVTIFQLSV